MIINLSGIIIRMAVSDLRVMGRATQGVRLINLKEDDGIAAVAKVECEFEDTDEPEMIDDITPVNPEDQADDSAELTNPDVEL
jgi:DNA gyrase subunit A